VLVADCIPVLLADRAGTTVAIAHAGWRGLAGGVIENTARRMSVDPLGLIAYLGPGIGPDAFEVGADVRDAFLARDADAAAAFTPHAAGKWLADLFLLARQRLRRAGVGEVHGGTLCTYSDARRFFSYRRERRTGRMAAVIWLTE
jgi:YfiH family protein